VAEPRRRDLAERIAARLGDRGIRAALIGGEALGANGVARSTVDVDLLVADRAALDARLWTDLVPDVRLSVDPADPLDGVADFDAAGPVAPVQLVLINRDWARAILARAVPRGGLFTVDFADLAILKAYADGPRDRVDLHLIAEHAGSTWQAEVTARLVDAGPPVALRAWRRFLSSIAPDGDDG